MKQLPIPGNTEAERALIGCLLSSERDVNAVADLLSPEHFVGVGYSTIFEAIKDVHAAGKLCAMHTISAELVRKNAYPALGLEMGDRQGITYLLDSLWSEVAPSYRVEDFADTLLAAHRHRARISCAQELAKYAYQQDEAGVQQVLDRLAQIELGAESKPSATFAEASDRYMETFAQRREDFKHGKKRGLPTGFHAWDTLFGGLQPSALYIIAAKTGIGKTAIALNMALNIVEQAKHALFFSLEMDEEEIVQRVFSKEARIDQAFLRDGDIDDEDYELLKTKHREMHDLPFKIDDRTYTLSDICTKAKREHAKSKLDLIVVDYLQLIDVAPSERGKYEQRYQEVGKFSRELKKLARTLKVPVVALAQLNRESEKSELPQLHHLYESSKLAQDSDMVAFIHVDQSEEEKRTKSEAYRVQVIVRKHRNGRLGQIELLFQPRLTGFYDIAREEYREWGKQ